jgi:hypothetical protein
LEQVEIDGGHEFSPEVLMGKMRTGPGQTQLP